MKEFIAELAITFLRRNNYSVIIGYEVDGDIKALNRQGRIYDNVVDGKYFASDGTQLNIPNGKFRIEYEEETE